VIRAARSGVDENRGFDLTVTFFVVVAEIQAVKASTNECAARVFDAWALLRTHVPRAYQRSPLSKKRTAWWIYQFWRPCTSCRPFLIVYLNSGFHHIQLKLNNKLDVAGSGSRDWTMSGRYDMKDVNASNKE